MVASPLLDQIIGARQAPGMAGQYLTGTRPHRALSTPELAGRELGPFCPRLSFVPAGVLGWPASQPTLVPAQVEADPIPRQAAERVIERFDPHDRKLLVVLHRRLGIDHVPSRGGGGVVELQDQPAV